MNALLEQGGSRQPFGVEPGLPLSRALGTERIGGVTVSPQLAGTLGAIARAGESGLVVASGSELSEFDLYGGMLGYWGVAEVTTTEGETAYRLPAGIRVVDIINELRYSPELQRMKEERMTQGFSVSTFRDIGLSGPGFDFRKHLLNTYYDTGLLQRVPGDRPPTRERARGAAYFFKHTHPHMRNIEVEREMHAMGGVIVGEYPDRSVPGKPNDNITDRSEYPAISIGLDDSLLVYVAVMALLSDEQCSTSGMNMFMTYDSVVEKDHQDHIAMGSIGALQVNAGGAVTTLRRVDDGRIVFQRKLEDDEVAIHNDRWPRRGPQLIHGTTSPLPLYLGHEQSRGALVTSIEAGRTQSWLYNILRLTGATQDTYNW